MTIVSRQQSLPALYLPFAGLLTAVLILFAVGGTRPCHAENNLQPTSPSQQQGNAIYEQLRAARTAQADINRAREAAFVQEKQQQVERLKQLRSTYQQKLALFRQLQDEVSDSEQVIVSLQNKLAERTQPLEDLFATWHQVAKDTLANQQNSLISSESPSAVAKLEQLVQQKVQPDSADLNALSLLLQQDIVDTGKVTQFKTNVALADGTTETRIVERIGPFTATSQGEFLHYDRASQRLSVAPQQPSSEWTQTIQSTAYQTMPKNATFSAVVDPSRGVVLDQLALSPTLKERLQQGGLIGYVILALGLAGLMLALVRWLLITQTFIKVERQKHNPETIDLSNPLGRILDAYRKSEHPQSGDLVATHGQSVQDKRYNTEALEVRLQEIVMQEVPRLDKGLGTLKLLAGVAPLLGLLGTVVGMINTFQTITLVGAADPKLMAGGISQALMTTVLGLIVAVPLLFAHSLVAAKSRLLMLFLSRQSLGFIAKSLEGGNSNTTKVSNVFKATQKADKGE